MLRFLHISNYALIRSLDISFDEGFTVITGETGAGKSILLGALSLLLGKRAEKEVLCDKAHKCVVEGTFEVSSLQLHDFFERNDLDFQEQTIIRREINEQGKSRAFINDTPVTLPVLRELSSALIDIHSQHQNLLLQDSNFQLDIVDQFAQNAEVLSAYRKSLEQLHQQEKAYEVLKQKCSQAALQQEFNAYTVSELEKAELQAGEQEDVEQRIRLLSSAEDIKAHLYRAAAELSEQEDNNVLSRLRYVADEVDALADLGDDFRELADRLKNAMLELQDVAYEIVRKESAVEVNPQELQRLNERVDLLFTLQHKYQVESVQDLLDLQARLTREMESYADGREQLQMLQAECQRLRDEAWKCARNLTESRNKALPELERDMMDRLHLLGMENARFVIRLTQTETLHPQGVDEVEFLFSANAGVEPASLAKVASGGEMSRLMLALKSIISDSRLLPTVIFDEIDTGISGNTANKVAAVMEILSTQHQVIAITHLPQIAARGSQHYLVFKEDEAGQTSTCLRMLDAEERVRAIAVMMSGSNVTPAALTAARELMA